MITIIPAIDLKGGKCVRLKQGLANEETVYSDSPAEQSPKGNTCKVPIRSELTFITKIHIRKVTRPSERRRHHQHTKATFRSTLKIE